MLLMTPSAAAVAIGAGCGGNVPSNTDAALLTILGLITPKVEAAIGVASLTLAQKTDRFRVDSEGLYHRFYEGHYSGSPPEFHAGTYDYDEGRARRNKELTLRLSNGFVVENTVVITDPKGVVVDSVSYPGIDIYIDQELGVITLDQWRQGTYYVTYMAGFEPASVPFPTPVDFDQETLVLQNVPDWMRLIVVNYLVQWYRTTQVSIKHPVGIRFDAVSSALDRAVVTAVHGKYYRPRMGVVFPT